MQAKWYRCGEICHATAVLLYCYTGYTNSHRHEHTRDDSSTWNRWQHTHDAQQTHARLFYTRPLSCYFYQSPLPQALVEFGTIAQDDVDSLFFTDDPKEVGRSVGGSNIKKQG